MELGIILSRAMQAVEYLRDTFWLDRTSRAVFTEFNLYNPATNLFTAVELVSFVSEGGDMMQTLHRSVFGATLGSGTSSTFTTQRRISSRLWSW